jgi:NADH-quinone oxidoreductase subunit E
METKETLDISKLIKKWKDKEGNLIMILHEIEDMFGYVPRVVSFQLSKELDIPMARIYEVLTFYNYFKLEPPGKHRIAICMGTACYLKGAQVILDEFKRILHIEEGQVTKDNMFQLDVVRCIGCCGLAPVIMIDTKVYGKLKKDDIAGIISQYIKKGEPDAKA